jgi:hypothetical protein
MNWKAVNILAAWAPMLLAQAPRVALLEVRLENWTSYTLDVPDPMKLASQTTEAPRPAGSRTFLDYVAIGDIVSVNGKPAKGVWTSRGNLLSFNPNAGPTLPIANAVMTDHVFCQWSFFTADGTFVGKLNDGGHNGGTGGTHATLGGLGAFNGVTGEHGWVQLIKDARRVSAAEDPSLRQTFGGGTLLVRIYLTPKTWPEVESTSAGPSVFHADGSLVAASNPAKAGEVLTVRAKGLGPTRPTLIPVGFKPFGQDPLEEVNSPVEITLGGVDAEVINKIGWPGTLDMYRVDFRVPDTGGGDKTKALRLTAAWIAGPDVQIPVQ